jgi:CBS domain-containing protein
VTRLTTLERDLLKDALEVVRQFKVFVRQHFRLDVL